MANGEKGLRLIARDQGAAPWPGRTRVSSQQLGNNPKIKWGPPLRLPLDVHPGRGGLTPPYQGFLSLLGPDRHFDDRNPSQYDLLNVRYAPAPSGLAMAEFPRPIKTDAPVNPPSGRAHGLCPLRRRHTAEQRQLPGAVLRSESPLVLERRAGGGELRQIRVPGGEGRIDEPGEYLGARTA